MATIQLEGLTKSFSDTVVAVNQLQFDIHDGELLALVGPSGCGKTTTLRLIAGLDQPSAGRIRIAGRDVTQLPPHERNVAMVFQESALFPHLDVRRNLAFGLRLRRLPRADIERRVTRVAEMLDLGELLSRRPDQLSGGQRRRVALGRALVHEPDCLLLDEPLSHLDAEARRDLRSLIRDIHQQTGTTTVYVTHDQEEAMAVGRRLAVMRNGQLQQLATPLDVYNSPANVFVARFIGATPMNLVDAAVHCENSRICVGLGKYEFELPAAMVADRFGERDRQAIVLGIRPENIGLAKQESDSGQNRLPANVGACELLGDRTDLHLDLSDNVQLLARVPGQLEYPPGESLEILLDPAQFHFFATEADGRNLLAS